MAAGRLIERRDSHQPMHAGLGRHQAEGVLARQREGHALQPRFFAGLVVEDVALQAPPLGPLHVHPQQHLGPVLRLDSARTRMDGDDGVGGVVLAAQHLLDFAGIDLGFERVERPGQVGGHVLTGLRPFDEHAGVVDPLLEGIAQLDVLAQALTAAQRHLGFGLVVPEVGRGDARLEAAQLFVEASGVKDSSAGRRPASAGRWNDGSDHR